MHIIPPCSTTPHAQQCPMATVFKTLQNFKQSQLDSLFQPLLTLHLPLVSWLQTYMQVFGHIHCQNACAHNSIRDSLMWVPHKFPHWRKHTNLAIAETPRSIFMIIPKEPCKMSLTWTVGIEMLSLGTSYVYSTTNTNLWHGKKGRTSMLHFSMAKSSAWATNHHLSVASLNKVNDGRIKKELRNTKKNYVTNVTYIPCI